MTFEQIFPSRVIAGLAVLGMLTLGAQPAISQGGAVRLTGMDGRQLSEETLESGVSIVVIWTSWSPRCRDIVRRVNAIEESWGKQARIVTVNFQEERAAIESFLSADPMSTPVFMDGNGAYSKKHAVTTLPGLVIYKDGKVAYHGKLPNDADVLIGRILG